VSVESADDTAARAREAGGRSLTEPFDVLPAGRMAVLADREGAVFCAWEPRERKGAQLVNEPGAWSMSALNTLDPEAAKAFYGSVFGWEAESMDLPGFEAWMWRLAGFVGGEPEQPVPRDLVASMLPIGGEVAADAPAQWSVDFWVADVRTAAETTGRLGGNVMVPPYDVPGTALKQAVVADPQGARLSITEVVAAG
jgi:predicted enzyme related to lactoylglutathione lyase